MEGLLALLLLLSSVASSSAQLVQSPSVFFAFGDSLTDTGNLVRTFNPALTNPTRLPYGITYFRQAAHRFSDGRLLIDCIVQSLGLPFLNPVLDFMGTDFSHGVNYAVGSATALNVSTSVAMGAAPYTPYSLDVQLQWHLMVLECIKRGVQGVTTFPDASAISQAAYFIESGGNDLTNYMLAGWTDERIMSVIPPLIAKVAEAIQLLYNHGARKFIVSGIGLLGCSPMVKYFAGDDGVLDGRGCIAGFNVAAQNYTASLGALTETLSQTLPDSSFVFLDLYSAFDEIVTFPDRYGIIDTVNACCASTSLGVAALNGYNPLALCNEWDDLCGDPNTFLNWDGIHFTDNIHRQIINMFIEGRFISPSNALSACGAVALERASGSSLL